MVNIIVVVISADKFNLKWGRKFDNKKIAACAIVRTEIERPLIIIVYKNMYKFVL